MMVGRHWRKVGARRARFSLIHIIEDRTHNSLRVSFAQYIKEHSRRTPGKTEYAVAKLNHDSAQRIRYTKQCLEELF
jgi:hypothetical protein